jgi:uncharacterized protein YndB with AHSA1/START domain
MTTFQTSRDLPTRPENVFSAVCNPECLARTAVAAAVRHIVELSNEQNLDRLAQEAGRKPP